jgi:predicted XRE-type DNA-binding protein
MSLQLAKNSYADNPVNSDPVEQVKLTLMTGIDQYLRTKYRSQYEAEKELGILQSDISQLRTGRTDRFSIVRLLQIAKMIGAKITVVIEI